MNEHRSAARHIAEIIYQSFGIEIDPVYCVNRVREIIEPCEQDHLQLITSVLHNEALMCDASIAKIVMQQLSLFTAAPEEPFELDHTPTKAALLTRWQAYINKLQQVLHEIERRTAANYEINIVMPPQKQILELQQECLDLSSEHYNNAGNLSAFYLYYIRMCEAAHITRFKYQHMPKFIAVDKFVSLSNFEKRKQALQEYDENIFQAFIQQGGIWAHGRCEIDATSIANIFYYKQAQQLMYLQAAKKIVLEVNNLQDAKMVHYNELPQDNRRQLWRLIQSELPIGNVDNIFYKFATFCNYNPGACFADLPAQLKGMANPAKLHAAIKIAGLLSNNLMLISRKLTEDWTPKRYLAMHWQRQYPLFELRNVGDNEHLRIWPNEMPYAPAHGMSLCGDGLIEGLEQYGSIAYEWNVPIDERAEMNNDTRDIEKMFREMAMLCPPLQQQLLPGEDYLYLFQNTVAYSTQHTQHLHIGVGTYARYPIYNLPATSTTYSDKLQTTIEFVHVGENPDAILLRFYFARLNNEVLLQFLLELNAALVHDFDPAFPVDLYIQLSVALPDRYVFIMEPHAKLLENADRKFVNPETGNFTIRKPQYVIPEADSISTFASDHRLYNGRQFLREFFDTTCKRGIYQYLQDYFKAHL